MGRNLLLTCIAILAATLLTYAQISPSDYVTTWETSFNQILIPAEGEYTVYYESIPSGISGTLPATGTFTGQQVITLPSVGAYRLAIKPTGAVPFHRISFSKRSGAFALTAIEQWGSIVWSSFEAAYEGCENLSAISATDAPVLTNVTSMRLAFSTCTSLVSAPNMNNWDVSKVTDMTQMFKGAYFFNQPIGNWDVSAVTDMTEMFVWTNSFNQPIGNWDVANVTDMSGMFAYSSFNQPIGNWNVSAVTNMSLMFAGASSFNRPIGDWNVSSVTTMGYMFYQETAFNQSLGKWTLNASVDMSNMLEGCGMDCNNYSSTLMGWASNPLTPSGRSLAADGITYGPAAANARDSLTIAKGWTITGDVLDPTCDALPVKLVYFKAKIISGNSVELNWETAGEIGNERFVIERSKDLIFFETVSEIRDVAGYSNNLHTYRAIDAVPYHGTSYYRLVQYDLDGTRTVSRTVSVVAASAVYTVYPNPVRDQSFWVNVDEPYTAEIRIHSVTGQFITFSRRTHDTRTVVITPSQRLVAGNYLVAVRERAFLRTFDLIVE